MLADLARGLTPREAAQLLRVSPDRVRTLIARGELSALNLGLSKCGRPRYVILPHHLQTFEQQHRAATVTTAPRRRKHAAIPDYLDG